MKSQEANPQNYYRGKILLHNSLWDQEDSQLQKKFKHKRAKHIAVIQNSGNYTKNTSIKIQKTLTINY